MSKKNTCYPKLGPNSSFPWSRTPLEKLLISLALHFFLWYQFSVTHKQKKNKPSNILFSHSWFMKWAIVFWCPWLCALHEFKLLTLNEQKEYMSSKTKAKFKFSMVKIPLGKTFHSLSTTFSSLRSFQCHTKAEEN